MQDFRRLQVWHKAHALFLLVHRLFFSVRDNRAPGLRAQMLRAAASISANIAEGCGRSSPREFVRFLNIALGSSRELENHAIAARDVGLISAGQFQPLDFQAREVSRMLIGLIGAIERQPPRAAR